MVRPWMDNAVNVMKKSNSQPGLLVCVSFWRRLFSECLRVVESRGLQLVCTASTIIYAFSFVLKNNCNLVLVVQRRQSIHSNNAMNLFAEFLLQRPFSYLLIFSKKTCAAWFVARKSVAHRRVVVVVSWPAAKKSAQVAIRLSWLKPSIDKWFVARPSLEIGIWLHSLLVSMNKVEGFCIFIVILKCFSNISNDVFIVLKCDFWCLFLGSLINYSCLSHIRSMLLHSVVSNVGNVLDGREKDSKRKHLARWDLSDHL